MQYVYLSENSLHLYCGIDTFNGIWKYFSHC